MVAKYLKISEPSVYRYLKAIKEKEKKCGLNNRTFILIVLLTHYFRQYT